MINTPVIGFSATSMRKCYLMFGLGPTGISKCPLLALTLQMVNT